MHALRVLALAPAKSPLSQLSLDRGDVVDTVENERAVNRRQGSDDR